jgi:hypothetical protein
MKKLLLVLMFVPLVSFGQNNSGIKTNSNNQLDPVAFLERHNNEIWSDGFGTLYFRGLSSIKINPKKQLRGFVFSGYLKKELTKINLYNDEGQFFWDESFENQKKLRSVNANGGLNVRDSPSTSGSIIGKLANGVIIKILNNTEKHLTINDVNKKTGESTKIEGNWIQIETYQPSNFFTIDRLVDKNKYADLMYGEVIYFDENNGERLDIKWSSATEYGSQSEVHSFSDADFNGDKYIKFEIESNKDTDGSDFFEEYFYSGGLLGESSTSRKEYILKQLN